MPSQITRVIRLVRPSSSIFFSQQQTVTFAIDSLEDPPKLKPSRLRQSPRNHLVPPSKGEFNPARESVIRYLIQSIHRGKSLLYSVNFAVRTACTRKMNSPILFILYSWTFVVRQTSSVFLLVWTYVVDSIARKFKRQLFRQTHMLLCCPNREEEGKSQMQSADVHRLISVFQYAELIDAR